MEASQRRRLGAYYTPPVLVDAIVAAALPPALCRGRTLTVVDPACGDGRFLAAAAQRIAALGGRTVLTGVDLDPEAIASAAASPILARANRGRWHQNRAWRAPELVVADALRHDWGDRCFDVVLGNPPFLGQLAAATTRRGRSPFGGGPYADAAAEFLALALRLAKPAGTVGLVLPLSLLSTRDTAAIRDAVDRAAALEWMWWSREPVFDAAVRTWAGVWRLGAERGAVRRVYGPSFAELGPMPMPSRWAALLHGDDVGTHDGPVLGDIASFAVDFRSQYYGLVGAVSDGVDGPPLITSGLIEPGRCLWGERTVRFNKQRYAAPRVDLGELQPAMRRWARSRLVPKILIANQTRVIEAVEDPAGEWLPSVPVITAVTADAPRLLDVLHSDGANRWVRAHAAGSGLSADSLRLTPSLLSSIPLPLEPNGATASGGS